MSAYDIAWLVVIGAAALGSIGLVFLTRPITLVLLRRLLRWLPPLLLIAPSGVPGHPGEYAPAFVVFVFEWLFQIDGNPWPALRILVAVAALVTLVIVVVHVRASRRGGEPAAES